ncbi:MAG: ASKHA domain-containing protein, partial [Ignisphaera sp.]
FGMRAIEGAIDQVFVYFDKSLSDYAVRYNVVGGKKPSGICGSGYIDLLANLYRLRLLNRRGKFAREIKSSRLIVENDLLRFVVAKAEETSIGRNIVVDEKDIDSLLLAKAAVASGFKMLLRYAGLESNDLSRVFVAGSFGSYINMENALTIGLLPNIPISRFIFVGNAAIVGAKAMLKSKEFREKASKIARAIEYVELAAQQEFSRIFMESLYLP